MVGVGWVVVVEAGDPVVAEAVREETAYAPERTMRGGLDAEGKQGSAVVWKVSWNVSSRG